MSRITHVKAQPKNIQYWDYYILCRLRPSAAMALQRMEYWDGTKTDGNVHAENENDVQQSQGKEPTQDVSRWVYKSQDELCWEMMGIVGEKKIKGLLNFLIKDLAYLKERNNPERAFDRRKQYEFQVTTVAEHLGYLNYIVQFFCATASRQNLAFFAIEMLTREGVFIESLSVKHVIKRIARLHEECVNLPHFIKSALTKDAIALDVETLLPFRNFAEWKARNCGMESAKARYASRKSAEAITVITNSNYNNNYEQYDSSESPASIPATLPDATAPATHTPSFSGTVQPDDTPVSVPEILPAVPDSSTGEQPSYSQQPDKPAETMTIGKSEQGVVQDTLLALPLTEPDMTGKWDALKCVQYAAWCNGRPGTAKRQADDLAAAKWLHAKDGALTLAQFKQAYDERRDAWWVETHHNVLYVTDMKTKDSTGRVRLYTMLEKAENRVLQLSQRAHLQLLAQPPQRRELIPPRPLDRAELKARPC